MRTPSPVALTAHVRAVPAAERSRLARAVRSAAGEGTLLIETCHRVDVFAFDEGAGERLVALDLPSGARLLRGPDAVRHAIAVAVGRDSVVVGEDQILHQIREALDGARRTRALDPLLERLFATALHAGRLARSWRRGPVRSLATAALDEIERQIGPVRARTILVVGAGRMGRLAAHEGAGRGASVVVASRTPESASLLAREVNGTTVPFEAGIVADDLAAVIVALAGPWPIHPGAANAFGVPPVVVDLSVPGAVPDGLTARLGPLLVTADELATIDAGADRPEDPQAARLDALIERATTEFVGWLEDHDRRAAATALALRVDRARAIELEALWRRLPDADPETRAAIEGMARHLAERLLREPLEHLRRDPDGTGEQAVREVFAL